MELFKKWKRVRLARRMIAGYNLTIKEGKKPYTNYSGKPIYVTDSAVAVVQGSVDNMMYRAVIGKHYDKQTNSDYLILIVTQHKSETQTLKSLLYGSADTMKPSVVVSSVRTDYTETVPELRTVICLLVDSILSGMGADHEEIIRLKRPIASELVRRYLKGVNNV